MLIVVVCMCSDHYCLLFLPLIDQFVTWRIPWSPFHNIRLSCLISQRNCWNLCDSRGGSEGGWIQMGFVCGLLMIQYSKSEWFGAANSFVCTANEFVLAPCCCSCWEFWKRFATNETRSNASSVPLCIHSIHLGNFLYRTEMHSDHKLPSRLGRTRRERRRPICLRLSSFVLMKFVFLACARPNLCHFIVWCSFAILFHSICDALLDRCRWPGCSANPFEFASHYGWSISLLNG